MCTWYFALPLTIQQLSNKGIGDAGSTADFRILFEIFEILEILIFFETFNFFDIFDFFGFFWNF